MSLAMSASSLLTAALDLLCLLLASSAFLPEEAEARVAAFTASSRSLPYKHFEGVTQFLLWWHCNVQPSCSMPCPELSSSKGVELNMAKHTWHVCCGIEEQQACIFAAMLKTYKLSIWQGSYLRKCLMMSSTRDSRSRARSVADSSSCTSCARRSYCVRTLSRAAYMAWTGGGPELSSCWLTWYDPTD